jgi:hypothetical protein
MRKRPLYQIHRFDPVWGFASETRIVDPETSAPGICDSVLPRRHQGF